MEFHLCSKAVIEHLKPENVSKPFKSGYEFEKEEDYFVAEMDFDKINSYYEEVILPHNQKNEEQIDFWTRELTAGTMDVSKITLKGIRKNGLFVELEWKIGLTTERNRAMCIFNLTNLFGCKNPIDFINTITH